jgi:hypothetical protein
MAKSEDIKDASQQGVLKKRGRKPKKDLADPQNNIHISVEELSTPTPTPTPINDISDIGDLDKTNTINPNNLAIPQSALYETENFVIENILQDEEEVGKPVSKKRGRKPKGGKIVQQLTTPNNNPEHKSNVILHLKCLLKDLKSAQYSEQIENYHFPNVKQPLSYEIIEGSTSFHQTLQNNQMIHQPTNQKEDSVDEDDTATCSGSAIDNKEVWKKLKLLEHKLHTNNISDKKSACFWCSYDFDNPPIYIPKHFIKDTYHVYGCFCSPECGVAYLMEENIDASAKFERYQIMNHIYSKIYNYNKNIKPSPNPYYMLDKYYGNLSIQEYRALLRNDRLFLIVDKPLTRILPELHEDNDDFIITNKIIPSNTYQVKKKNSKKPTSKASVVNEQFGLAAAI